MKEMKREEVVYIVVSSPLG